MKIARIESFVLPHEWKKNFVFVRIETNDGTVGWGECYNQTDRENAIIAHLRSFGAYLIGRPAGEIRHILQIGHEDYAQRRVSMEYYCAISGIEQALWDILGKRLGVPAYELLGGPVRRRIRVYANGWANKLENRDEIVEAARSVLDDGFTAIKMDPLPRPWRGFLTPAEMSRAVGTVAAVREAVGNDTEILIDLHRRLTPVQAVEFADRIREYNPGWLEEPCPAENLEALADFRRSVRAPVVTGETLYGRSAFRPVLRARAVDIINPDVGSCGGILELLEISAAADVELIAVSPHNYNSPIALSATVQAAACMVNFRITEYFVPFREVGRRLCRDALEPAGGYITIPDRPGLGLEIDEDALRAACISKPPRLRSFRRPENEGP